MSESEARIEDIRRRAHGISTLGNSMGGHVDQRDVRFLLERISELEEENQRLRSLEGRVKQLGRITSQQRERMRGYLSERDAAGRLRAEVEVENQHLRATLEKKEQHLAEVRRGGLYFTDSGEIDERRTPSAGSAF